MFKKILVTTDFSPHSRYALQKAIQFSSDCQAELTCLHVVNQGWLDSLKRLGRDYDEEDVRKQIEVAEKAHADELKHAQRQYPVKFVVAVGRSCDQILDYVNANAIDFVFMGAHGTYYLNDFILGTTAEGVVKHTRVPVQLIKKESLTYQRIVVAVDFSQTSKRAVEIAYQSYPKAQFLLLYVADVWHEKVLDDSKFRQELSDKMRQEVQSKLTEFLHECAVDHRCFETHFIGGYPANDIARYATLWNAQLVVIGTRGNSMLHYVLIGQVAERLLRLCEVDTLVVPP